MLIRPATGGDLPRILADARPAIEALAAHGYCHFPYQPEVMHWFCKPSPALRAHQLHLVPVGSLLWKQRLPFRDALHRGPALAARYRDLRLRLAGEFSNDRETCTEARSPFVRSVLEGMDASRWN